jgi:hypothetical protein
MIKPHHAVAVAALFLVVLTSGLSAESATALVTPTQRDGHADFNFLLGHWHTHYRILRHRLAHDTVWIQCDGDSDVRPFWGTDANLQLGDLHCPPPRGYIQGMTLRMYDESTHQWSLYFGTKTRGLGTPPVVGHFSNGVGDFYADDTEGGKPVIVRYRWAVRAGLPHFEQAESTDNGQTWEVDWISDYTR